MNDKREAPKTSAVGGFRLGRLAGIDVVVHWSWFLIFFFLTWSLAEGLYRNDHPNWSTGAAWLAGAATSLLLFVSVLLHELAHSVVARRLGMTVTGITLFIFGGVSSLTEEPANARQEFVIAGVGPATSFVLAGLFGLAGLALHGTGVGGAAFYLAFINALLAVFNLLPGFPLDGGRLLRAAAWARSGNLLQATRVASQAGTVLSFVLMAGGLIAILLGNFLTGAWFIIIGWFLRSQSEASYRQVVAHDVLQGISVVSALRRDVHPVPPDLSLSSLSDYMLADNQACHPVVFGDRLLGLVCLRDLEKYAREQWQSRQVSEVMTPRERLQAVQTTDDLAKAAEMMASGDLQQVPVMEDGHFAGFVTRADVIHLIQVRRAMGGPGPNQQTQRPVGMGR